MIVVRVELVDVAGNVGGGVGVIKAEEPGSTEAGADEVSRLLVRLTAALRDVRGTEFVGNA